MKHRVMKKRIHRAVKAFALHKIPKAFNNSRERKQWIKEISNYHINKGKVEQDGVR